MYEQIAIDALAPEFNVERIAGSSLGCIRTAETRAKIAAKAKGRKRGPRSVEHRARLSDAHKGKPKAPDHLAALQAGRSRRIYTEDQRQALSKALKDGYESGLRAREKSEIHKNRISKAFSKLTADQVRDIKRLSAEGCTGVELSKRFEIAASSVSQILRGQRYRWVTD